MGRRIGCATPSVTSAARPDADTRASHYERNLQTMAGEVQLKVPTLRHQTFETAIIERYRRRDSSAEEVLIEMYLAGESRYAVSKTSRKPWGTRVSPSTVSDLNKKFYGTWRNRPIEGEHPYAYPPQLCSEPWTKRLIEFVGCQTPIGYPGRHTRDPANNLVFIAGWSSGRISRWFKLDLLLQDVKARRNGS
jgi:hypothetical protein